MRFGGPFFLVFSSCGSKGFFLVLSVWTNALLCTKLVAERFFFKKKISTITKGEERGGGHCLFLCLVEISLIVIALN